MSERFVMTEALATLEFAVYLGLAFSFFTTRQFVTPISVQMAGVLLASLRYSFIPLALLLSVALPFVAFYKMGLVDWKILLLRLLVAVGASQASQPAMVISTDFSDCDERRRALRAMKRNPLAVLMMGFSTNVPEPPSE